MVAFQSGWVAGNVRRYRPPPFGTNALRAQHGKSELFPDISEMMTHSGSGLNAAVHGDRYQNGLHAFPSLPASDVCISDSRQITVTSKHRKSRMIVTIALQSAQRRYVQCVGQRPCKDRVPWVEQYAANWLSAAITQEARKGLTDLLCCFLRCPPRICDNFRIGRGNIVGRLARNGLRLRRESYRGAVAHDRKFHFVRGG